MYMFAIYMHNIHVFEYIYTCTARFTDGGPTTINECPARDRSHLQPEAEEAARTQAVETKENSKTLAP